MVTYEKLLNVKKMVAFGDSITYGMTASAPQNCWASLLVSMLNDALKTDIELKNCGICGNILSVDSPAYKYSSKPCGLERLVNDVIAESPDLLLIAFGLNDSRGGTALGTFRKDYQGMIDKIRSQANPIIVAVNLFCMHESFYKSCVPWNYSDYELAKRFNECIREVAEKNDLIYVDVFSLQYGLDCSICEDHCHPNDLGHRLIANKAFESIICSMKNQC